MPKHPKLSLLLTGNELMAGDIVDSNSAMIAQMTQALGCPIFYKATVGDDLDLLSHEITRIAEFSDVLIVNGGLGPTIDDLTAEALANVMGVALEEQPQALQQLERWCESKRISLNAANRKQVILPQGIELIANATGSAPGFSAMVRNCKVICTPGVPSELKHMFRDEILPNLDISKNAQVKRYRLRVFGMGESGIQTLLKKHIANWPTEIELGFRASLPMLEVKLQAQNKSDYPALEQCLAQVKGLLGDHIVTEDHRVISAVVKDLLIEKQQTITFAESCTGGLIAANLTEIAGASAVFEAGFVTYSNAMKQALVNVSDASLRQHGAVSEPVVREMLSGALAKTNANIGVAVSGVAGPSGGSNEKPVGTVWIAWGTATHAKAHCFYFPVDRKRFQILVAAVAFDLVRRELLGINEQAIYFKERTFKPRH